MFLGEHKHILDTKGRLAVPVKFRAKLEGGATLTRGLDKCLFVFANEEWNEFVKKLIALPFAQSHSRAFARLMLAGACAVELDTQGRMLIPDYLREFAHLKKGVVIAGLYTRLELWDVDAWTAYKQKTESASEEIAEQLGELGI